MTKKETRFLDKYFKDFKKLIDGNERIKKKLIIIKKILINTRKIKKKNTYFWQWGVVFQLQVILVLI
jgi:hypothetical protein